jgi:hypothetical protein
MQLYRYAMPTTRLKLCLSAFPKIASKLSPTTLLRIRLILVFSLLLLPETTQAEPTIAISDDGHGIQLHEDGSWIFLSEDRFATTSQGTPIRLRQDGHRQTPTGARHHFIIAA